MTLLGTRFRALLGAVVMVMACLLTLAAPAAAEPTAADRATARSLAREGFEALKTDDFVTAEDRFRRADALVHAPTLVVDHARALVGLGRLVEAHERYSLVLREGVSPNAAWPWKRAYADAQKEIEVIKTRLAWLTIEVVGPIAPTEPQVSVDGKPIPAAAVGVRRATDPGERSIKAGAPGFYSKEETVVLGEGAEQTVRFELEAMPPEVLAETPAETQGTTTNQAQSAATPTEPARDNTLAYVALGVGGAGLVAWGVSGVFFLKEHSELKDNCTNNECEDDQQQTNDRYETLGWISGVSAAVGIAGAATGVTLLLLNNSDSTTQAKPTGVHVTPYFAGSSVGVTGQF